MYERTFKVDLKEWVVLWLPCAYDGRFYHLRGNMEISNHDRWEIELLLCGTFHCFVRKNHVYDASAAGELVGVLSNTRTNYYESPD
jgi:hypothetical protein